MKTLPDAATGPEVPPSESVSTRSLTPVHPGTNYNCIACEQPVAHWRVYHARYGVESQTICALCFFKTSGWLERNRQRFNVVTRAIGLRRKASLALDAMGNLTVLKDADDVLGAIVLHDRFEILTRRPE